MQEIALAFPQKMCYDESDKLSDFIKKGEPICPLKEQKQKTDL